MSLIVRRINRTKWEKPMPNVDADAITNCIKTYLNTLSVWEISNTDKLEEAVLAIVSGSKQTQLSTLNIIHFEDSILEEKNIIYKNDPTTADTVIQDLKESHIDIQELTYSSLGVISTIIQQCISGSRVVTFSRRQILKLLAKATIHQRFNIDDMHDDFIKSEKDALIKEVEILNKSTIKIKP